MSRATATVRKNVAENSIGLADIEEAARIVHGFMPATPQFRWPLLCERLGTDIWIKHENHTPAGAFKIRGGLNYFHHLARAPDKPEGVISATRGNHGQSVAIAARRYGIKVTIVVPRGNAQEKNAAMRCQGAELIEYGEDFQAAREHAQVIAKTRGLHLIPSFHPWLIAGVATLSLELLKTVSDLDTVYVPIGLGSSICGMVAARDALGLHTKIVGVVSTHAPAYALSFAAGCAITHAVSTRLADGMACSTPDPAALDTILRSVDRIVQVSDDEIAGAMRTLFECTHNVAEGAGAAALAAATQERERLKGHKIAAILSGGNVDRAMLASVLGTSWRDAAG